MADIYGWVILVLAATTLIWLAKWCRRREQTMLQEIEREQYERIGWNFNTVQCGNCKYWPLSRYYEARKDEGGKPDGQGGNQCDGSMSDCRAALPGSYPDSGRTDTRWPQVKRDDWCKHFERRDWLA